MARLLALGCYACRSANPSGGEEAPPIELSPPSLDPPNLTSPNRGTARAEATIRTEYYQIRASLPEECSAPRRASRSTDTRRLGIELAIEPTSDVQVPADPYYARLVDAERNVYEATLGGCGAALAPTLPARGQTARGWIVFELPRTARPVTLLYAPELVGAAKAELAIELLR
jgi:hypothetical protein